MNRNQIDYIFLDSKLNLNVLHDYCSTMYKFFSALYQINFMPIGRKYFHCLKNWYELKIFTAAHNYVEIKPMFLIEISIESHDH